VVPGREQEADDLDSDIGATTEDARQVELEQISKRAVIILVIAAVNAVVGTADFGNLINRNGPDVGRDVRLGAGRDAGIGAGRDVALAVGRTVGLNVGLDVGALRGGGDRSDEGDEDARGIHLDCSCWLFLFIFFSSRRGKGKGLGEE